MDSVNNSIQNGELEEAIALSKNKNDMVHMCQVMNQFVTEVQDTVTVPKGFMRQPGLPLTWQETQDRHNLKAVADEITVPGTAYVNNGGELIDTMVKLYQIRIVGVIYFNISISGFQAMHAAYSDGEVSFTMSGSIPVNFIAGYVSDPADIRTDIIDNLIFGVVLERPSVVKNGVLIQYDPDNPELFYSAFDGSSEGQFFLPFQETITSTPIIS